MNFTDKQLIEFGKVAVEHLFEFIDDCDGKDPVSVAMKNKHMAAETLANLLEELDYFVED